MLKVLMLKRSLDAKRAELADLERKEESFQTREAELETAINEVEPGNAQQEAAVNAEIEAFEADKSAHDTAKESLRGDIASLEAELEELERNAPKPPAAEETKSKTIEKRGVATMPTINIRSLPMSQRAFDALPMERRDAMLSENMYRYSKLLNRVRVRNVTGEARQTIAGTVPEAVWTEMCGAINELSFSFNQITVDGYKVAGFVPVCNSLLEDNDINLASWIVEMLSEAIGLAMDKAILYGKGSASKMPLGIVTRLAQQSKPGDYPANAPAWEDLHTSNVIKITDAAATGAAFWAALMEATGATYTRYNRGNLFWAMNSKTYSKLKSKLITFTATGDIVANLFGTLPVVNGDIDILEFIPDGDIIGGYGDLYLLSQRSGMTIDSSTEVQFIQDNTVFRAKQRADGQPIIPKAFVAINIENKAVTTAMDFAADTANDAQLTALSVEGVTLSPAFAADQYTYTGGTAAKNAGKIEATSSQPDAQIAIAVNGENLRNGGTGKFTASASNTVTATVTQGNAVRVYTVTFTGAAGD